MLRLHSLVQARPRVAPAVYGGGGIEYPKLSPTALYNPITYHVQ